LFDVRDLDVAEGAGGGALLVAGRAVVVHRAQEKALGAVEAGDDVMNFWLKHCLIMQKNIAALVFKKNAKFFRCKLAKNLKFVII
jgi:hypothetical protein